MNHWSGNINTEHKKNITSSRCPPLRYSHWSYVTRRPGFLKSLPVSAASVLESCEVLSDSPSFLERRTADWRGLCSNDALTASLFCVGANRFNTTTSLLNPSAWGHLNPSSYCDVGRLFYGVFKLWSKLQRKK